VREEEGDSKEVAGREEEIEESTWSFWASSLSRSALVSKSFTMSTRPFARPFRYTAEAGPENIKLKMEKRKKRRRRNCYRRRKIPVASIIEVKIPSFLLSRFLAESNSAREPRSKTRILLESIIVFSLEWR